MREHHVDPGFALGTQFVPEGQRELADAVKDRSPMRVGPSEGRPRGWINGRSASSAAPVLTAFLTASVSTHHTQPEPDDRTQDRRGDRGSQSGHVKCQMRKSSRTSSVFWIMKTISSPIPVSDARHRRRACAHLKKTPNLCCSSIRTPLAAAHTPAHGTGEGWV